jgi:hypothetical protein
MEKSGERQSRITVLHATFATLAFVVFLLGYASLRAEILYVQTQLSELISGIFTGNIRF